MKYKNLFEYVDKYNRDELVKYNYDIEPMYDISLFYGKKLAETYNADEEIVLISLALMDAKLPESVKKKTPKEHVSMSLASAKTILDKVEDITEDAKVNILKCIEEHHGVDKYYSIESEIVANADCYKFLSIKGMMTYHSILARRLNDFESELDQLEYKMDEKINHLSLDLAKEELNDNYRVFKKHINDCRENK